MQSRVLVPATAGLAAITLILSATVATPQAQGKAVGVITGHVRLTAPAPANSMIRMGADPLCSRANAGKRLTQDVVVRSADGGLANAFVDLQGTFPSTPPPAAPVVIDQKGCVFVPRVVGVQVGQTLSVTNTDQAPHNVHSLSTKGNEFNVSQPKPGMKSTFQLKNADVLRIKCDIHSWMVSYVGVSPHPYFAVSATDGTFTIANVPVGRHSIRVWHERYGRLTATVGVQAGATATVNFSYTGKEQPSAAGLLEMVVPGQAIAVALLARR